VTKLPTVALATVISVLSNPVTSSLNVAVTLKGALTVVADADVKVTDGAVILAVRTS
jgi:nitrogen fixation protein FixH